MKKSLSAILLLLSLAGISSASSAACVIQTINAGDTKTASLASDDCIDNNANGLTYYYDYYEFNGTSGQQISILNSSSTIDPDLTLFYPDGTYRYDDNSGGGTAARIPASGTITLPATGKYGIAASSAVARQSGAYTLVLSSAAPTVPAVTTTEFYNTTLKHYFVTADPNEATAIDNGSAGAGWSRTGYSYNVFANQAAAAGSNPVCRFYGTPGVGPNSHFYTVDAGECAGVKKDPGWFYEGIAYYIQPPQSDACPSGTQPIYRVYNNRAAFNDSNHRFITAPWVYEQMNAQGWIQEGVAMCSTGLTNPTGVTGGTFPSGGASVNIGGGTIPPYVNPSAPAMATEPQVPAALDIKPEGGDLNITKDAPAYTFTLTGASDFETTTPGAVKIVLPFSTSGIPAADINSAVKIFIRLLNQDDNAVVDVTGDVTASGASGTVSVELRGLPTKFSAVAIYNPNMEALSSEETLGDMAGPVSAVNPAKTTWPTQGWCLHANVRDRGLIDAIKTLHGLATDPTRAQIVNDLRTLVLAAGKKSQGIYEKNGLIGPNLYSGRCGNTVGYYMHMINAGSHFQGNDPSEVISHGTTHYGRLYIGNGIFNDNRHTMLEAVSHEMHHAVQSSYGIVGRTTKGYIEGAATTYGKTIEQAEVISVRTEVALMTDRLLTPDTQANGKAGKKAYANEDFFAYVGKQYNAGSLAYLSGLYAQMASDIGQRVRDPVSTVMYGAVNKYFSASFNASLRDTYLDFLKQRVLSHNVASQLGHAGDTAAGFAANLFDPALVNTHTVAVADCSSLKDTRLWIDVKPFSARAIVINPAGVVSKGDGPTVSLKFTLASGSIGGLWDGFSNRAGATDNIKAANTYKAFGKNGGDQIIAIIANLDSAKSGNVSYEISCAGPSITGIAPAKGPTDTAVTITGSGFGTATDTRAVYFNGIAASNVTWTSDTQAVAKVPQNASTGEVVVEVNGVKSNGVNFEVIALCSATQNAGADTPDTRTVELGKPAGTFTFAYETYSQKDQILVKYQGGTLFDTGCVGASGSKALSYSGSATQITVQVIPNCAGGTGTAWNYSVSCPN